MSRIGKCVRNTSETQIEVSINLDGTGKPIFIQALVFLTIC